MNTWGHLLMSVRCSGLSLWTSTDGYSFFIAPLNVSLHWTKGWAVAPVTAPWEIASVNSYHLFQDILLWSELWARRKVWRDSSRVIISSESSYVILWQLCWLLYQSWEREWGESWEIDLEMVTRTPSQNTNQLRNSLNVILAFSNP